MPVAEILLKTWTQISRPRKTKCLSLDLLNVVLIDKETAGDFGIPANFVQSHDEFTGRLRHHLDCADSQVDGKLPTVIFVSGKVRDVKVFGPCKRCAFYEVHKDLAHTAVTKLYHRGSNKAVADFRDILSYGGAMFYNWNHTVTLPLPSESRLSIFTLARGSVDAIVFSSRNVLELMGVPSNAILTEDQCRELAAELKENKHHNDSAEQHLYFVDSDGLEWERIFMDRGLVVCIAEPTFDGVRVTRSHHLAHSLTFAHGPLRESYVTTVDIASFPNTHQVVKDMESK